MYTSIILIQEDGEDKLSSTEEITVVDTMKFDGMLLVRLESKELPIDTLSSYSFKPKTPLLFSDLVSAFDFLNKNGYLSSDFIEVVSTTEDSSSWDLQKLNSDVDFYRVMRFAINRTDLVDKYCVRVEADYITSIVSFIFNLRTNYELRSKDYNTVLKFIMRDLLL